MPESGSAGRTDDVHHASRVPAEAGSTGSATDYRALVTGGRFSTKAAIASFMSSDGEADGLASRLDAQAVAHGSPVEAALTARFAPRIASGGCAAIVRGELAGRLLELLVGDELLDEPDPVRLVGVDAGGGEDQLLRLARADEARAAAGCRRGPA